MRAVVFPQFDGRHRIARVEFGKGDPCLCIFRGRSSSSILRIFMFTGSGTKRMMVTKRLTSKYMHLSTNTSYFACVSRIIFVRVILENGGGVLFI